MAIRKRGAVWWLDFTTPSGERVRRSAETADKTEAQELHDKVKAEAWRVQKLGSHPIHTWNEAVVRWLIEQSHKASIESDKIHLRWLDRHLNGVDLTSISRAMLDNIAAAKLAEGVSPATVNRVMEVLRAILRKCADEWEWIERAPKVRMLKEPSRRIRFLTRSEAQRLLRNLPPHLADMAAFALATGLRRANVTGLRWDAVDLENRRAWVHPDEAKARRAIPVPLNEDAVAVVQRQIGKHRELVFSFRGKAIRQVSTKAWYAALDRAGIADFRWHDLRHTWASWHVQGGTPLFALQDLGGWESAEMVRRYAHLAADHLAPWADRLAINNNQGTNSAQRPEKEKRPRD
jgi:integrase